MRGRIIQFGTIPSGILAAFAGNGYKVDGCEHSISKLKQALRQPDDLDAFALAENGASKAIGVIAAAPSVGKVPLILFQDEGRTCDPSQFDLIVPEHAPLPNLLPKLTALIERSRILRAETKISAERFHTLLRKSVSLLEESVRAVAESQHIRAKFKRCVTDRISIPCVLVVDDYARWRETMCAMLETYAHCRMLCEAGDGIEAVQRATELKPELILLDLDLPRLNGIEAAKQITQFSPESAILFVSMNNCEDVVLEALSTGARGYLLKADAGNELWPAIEAVLHNNQYLSRGLRGRYSAKIN